MSRLRLLVLFGWVLCSLGPSARAEAPRKLQVLTSFLPVYCLTANVAGSLAQVENLLPGNVEPHDFQFSRKDLQKLARADLIIINGLGLERWLEKVLRNSPSPHRQPVVELAAGLYSELIYAPARNRRREEADPIADRTARPFASAATLPNPHTWLDPVLARHGVTNILRALQQADPAHAEGYSANAVRYLARLDRLEAEIQQGLQPLQGTSLVTYHDAFAYFARRFGLNVAGIIEPVPDVNPSLKHLADLYAAIRVNRVQAIFTEAPAPSRLARQIGSDLHLPLAQLDTLETGPPNPAAYEQAMRDNLRVLLTHLKPDAQTASR